MSYDIPALTKTQIQHLCAIFQQANIDIAHAVENMSRTVFSVQMRHINNCLDKITLARDLINCTCDINKDSAGKCEHSRLGETLFETSVLEFIGMAVILQQTYKGALRIDPLMDASDFSAYN